MSVILIKNHDENIYNITEKQETQYDGKKSPGYKAKLRERNEKMKAVPMYQRGLKAHATMGLPEECLPDPHCYLRKHTGKLSHTEEEQIKANAEKHVCVRKAKVFPNKEEIKAYNEKKEEEAKKQKNFIVKNIKTVLNMKPKEPEQKVVIERGGESKYLTEGLEPIYIKSAALGKTPHYLEQFIKQSEKLHQMMRDASGVERPKCEYITRDQREQLLMGLKHNWEELQKQYQGLPILTDTIPKILRKSKLEAELKQLEKDIVLVERHPYIYVYQDNVTNFN